MPGLVAFGRRWAVGSDDLVVPGVFLATVHFIWLIICAVCLGVLDNTWGIAATAGWKLTGPAGNAGAGPCGRLLREQLLGYIVILTGCLLVEAFMACVANRGTILDAVPRASMKYLLYVRLVFLLVEVVWLSLGVFWLAENYSSCSEDLETKVLLGLIICDTTIVFSIGLTVWCTFDSGGRAWVRMKRYEQSLQDSKNKKQYRRSSGRRNWRQRKVIRAYQHSWNHRFRMMFCCIGKTDRTRNSFADVARLFSEFFRDLDVVPSDIIAGFVVLRRLQTLERERVVEEKRNDTYMFLSGIPVTPRTKFVALNTSDELELFKKVTYYMRYAVGAYGWPMYLVMNNLPGVCRLFPNLSCICTTAQPSGTMAGHGSEVDMTEGAEMVVQDNCCLCNSAVLQEILPGEPGDVELVYATYHVDIGETPFFVAVDHNAKKIVVSIRGTLSMKDILTDLNAEYEAIPTDIRRDNWLGHKGMVQAAVYMRNKLIAGGILNRAKAWNPEKGTNAYPMVIVGHSLGAGTAAILAILLRQRFPDLRCYSYSPPGGLLTLPVVNHSKDFVISVILGKDVVSRIGLHQMETLRADLLSAIHFSNDPKWKTLVGSLLCSCCSSMKQRSMDELDETLAEFCDHRSQMRTQATAPRDNSISLSTHQPMYPPGRIIQIVRRHPSLSERVLSTKEPVFQALWADNETFDHVLISPRMFQDHMPDQLLNALDKVLLHFGPAKPQRHSLSSTSGAVGPTSVIVPGFPSGSGSLLTAKQAGLLTSYCSDTDKTASSTRVIAGAQKASRRNSSFTPSSSSSGPASPPPPPSRSSARIGRQRIKDSHAFKNSNGTPSPHKLCMETSFDSIAWASSGSNGSRRHTTIALVNESNSSANGSRRSSSSKGALTPKVSVELSHPESASPINGNHDLRTRQRLTFPEPANAHLAARQQHDPLPWWQRTGDCTSIAKTKWEFPWVRDDMFSWVGAAPLASPETLSEVSSIGSRRSFSLRERGSSSTAGGASLRHAIARGQHARKSSSVSGSGQFETLSAASALQAAYGGEPNSASSGHPQTSQTTREHIYAAPSITSKPTPPPHKPVKESVSNSSANSTSIASGGLEGNNNSQADDSSASNKMRNEDGANNNSLCETLPDIGMDASWSSDIVNFDPPHHVLARDREVAKGIQQLGLNGSGSKGFLSLPVMKAHNHPGSNQTSGDVSPADLPSDTSNNNFTSGQTATTHRKNSSRNIPHSKKQKGIAFSQDDEESSEADITQMLTPKQPPSSSPAASKVLATFGWPSSVSSHMRHFSCRGKTPADFRPPPPPVVLEGKKEASPPAQQPRLLESSLATCPFADDDDQSPPVTEPALPPPSLDATCAEETEGPKVRIIPVQFVDHLFYDSETGCKFAKPDHPPPVKIHTSSSRVPGKTSEGPCREGQNVGRPPPTESTL